MNVLPRYHPSPPQSGGGCAEHDDPNCLCDVVVTKPTPIYRGEHKYHQLALDELDDYNVTERNIHEFFQIVLGLHAAEQAMHLEDRPLTSEYMLQFPQEIRDALQVHMRGLSHWTTAIHELPPGVERKAFAKQYPITANGYRVRHYHGTVSARVAELQRIRDEDYERNGKPNSRWMGFRERQTTHIK